MQLKWFALVKFEPTTTQYSLYADNENYRIILNENSVCTSPVPRCEYSIDWGMYLHYKHQDLYVFVCTAYMDSDEFSGWCVVYHSKGDLHYWARPIEVFLGEAINSKGQRVPRFVRYPKKS